MPPDEGLASGAVETGTPPVAVEQRAIHPGAAAEEGLRQATGAGLPTGAAAGETPEGFEVTEPEGEEDDLRAQMISSFVTAYFELWGVTPPPGYVERFIDDGYNIYEFVAYERGKADFRHAQTYRGKYAGFAQQLARLFGTRP
jgi:hypothetical protein